MTPRIRPSRATASGVPPALAMPLGDLAPAPAASACAGCRSPCGRSRRPRRRRPCGSRSPSTSMPLIRVCGRERRRGARAAAPSRGRGCRSCSLASTTIERPSGVSSASEASCAASASSRSLTPGSGTNSVAWRLPSVIVPVLSSSSVSTSPAASTARPDMASTLKRTSRSMPAMPMADSSAPMVVGIRVTNSATSTIIGTDAAGIGGEARDRDDGEQEDDASCRRAGC